jgi:hypothetical protein
MKYVSQYSDCMLRNSFLKCYVSDIIQCVIKFGFRIRILGYDFTELIYCHLKSS